MGARHRKPDRLGEKLLQIRLFLGLSQDGMLRRLDLADELLRSRISAYELGKRVPDLPVLLKYARSVGISTDVLIDDEMELPGRLLQLSKQGTARGKSVSRKRRK